MQGISKRFILTVFGAFALAALPASAMEVTGAGATFPYPVYAQWGEAYAAETGVTIAYQAVGSGQGIKQIEGRTVVFGASDRPLKPEALASKGLLQFPTLIGGAVPVVNVPGIAAGAMTLNGDILAKIFLGDLRYWDDSAIQALNPTIALPHAAIAVVHRDDGSGTTFIFSDYLSKMSEDWADGVGADTALDWPTGVGARGNEGVAEQVGLIEGAIGYVEYAYALKDGLAYTNLVNAAGKTVAPSGETFQAAAVDADWASTRQFYLVLTNQPGENAWPIAGATYILMPLRPEDPAASEEAIKFFTWAYAKGDTIAADLDFVPMPDSVVALIEESWKQITAD